MTACVTSGVGSRTTRKSPPAARAAVGRALVPHRQARAPPVHGRAGDHERGDVRGDLHRGTYASQREGSSPFCPLARCGCTRRLLVVGRVHARASHGPRARRATTARSEALARGGAGGWAGDARRLTRSSACTGARLDRPLARRARQDARPRRRRRGRAHRLGVRRDGPRARRGASSRL